MWERLRSGLGYAAIYGINLLFVVKYAPRYGIPWSAGTLAYACAFCAILWVCRRRFFVRFFQQPSAYFAALFLTAAVLAFLMFQFDPTTLRNGRAPAITCHIATSAAVACRSLPSEIRRSPSTMNDRWNSAAR